MSRRDYRRGSDQRYEDDRYLPVWFWMLVGFAPGALVAAMIYIEYNSPKSPRADKKPVIKTVIASKNTINKSVIPKKPVAVSKPRASKPVHNRVLPKKIPNNIEYTYHTVLTKTVVPSVKKNTNQVSNKIDKKTAAPVKDKSVVKKSVKKPVKKQTDKPKNIKVAKLTAPQRSAQSGVQYLLQAGAYSKRTQAQLQKNRLAKIGVKASISEVTKNGKKLYRIHIGPFSSNNEASKRIQDLKKKRIEAIAIRLKNNTR